jgi:2-keto-3-deoxy-L-rhamnonate aldolase RhmA
MREGEQATGEDFVLTLWTDDPMLAAVADRAGVDRIGVDLETRGKRERQAGLGTWVSSHRPADLRPIRNSVSSARLFARVNPVSGETREEVEALLSLGVEVIMLPMFRSAEELEEFAGVVAGRATVVPLLETVEAARDIERVTRVTAVHEIHIGINDLALSCGMANRFNVLDSELTERVAACVLQAGWRLGIGAIGSVGDSSLPIAPDLVYAQYARLGSSAALISRVFLDGCSDEGRFREAIARSRAHLAHWRGASGAELAEARAGFREALARCGTW